MSTLDDRRAQRDRGAQQPDVSADPSRLSHRAGGSQQRFDGVDAFRGLVLAVMVLTPVTGQAGSYPLLGHAEWNGFTVADAILPLLLVTSGVSLAMLLRPPVTSRVRLRLIRRVIALTVLGILYNAWGAPLDLGNLRLTGVLQLIGISGAIAAGAVLVARRLTGSLVPLIVLAIVIPTVHGLLLARAAVDGVICTLGAAGCSPWHGIDAALLGRSHTYAGGGAGHDPEGVVVMVVASSLVLVGFVLGDVMRRNPVSTRRLVAMLMIGLLLVGVGAAVHQLQPVNKRLHSPAFTLVAGGLGIVGVSWTVLLLDRHRDVHGIRGRRWRCGSMVAAVGGGVRAIVAWPLVTLGRNALVVFLTERIVLSAMEQTTTAGDGGNLGQVLLDGALGVTGIRVHLAYTAALLALILAVTSIMRLLRWHISL